MSLGLATVGFAPAQATESGTSFYLLGSGGPEAAILPPLPGIFADNQVYFYTGSAGANKDFEIGGKVVAGLKATVGADFATLLWVPTTNFAHGTLAFGAVLPAGEPSIDASVVLTGPGGNPIGLSAHDQAFVLGDPIAAASLGWTSGKLHFTVSELLNVPIGDYREGQLANLAFHRWAGDTSAALTWHDDASGWDVSAKTGLTFNGTNPDTEYTTGTEFHVEGSVEKTFGKDLAFGVQAYWFDQVSGDSGAGNRIGPFEGRVAGIGPTVATSFLLAKKIPVKVRLKVLTEFDAVNRLSGTSGWFDVSLPLWVKLPPGAPHE